MEEVRRLQIAQYYTFPYLLYFLTAVQLSHVPKCCRSHMWNEKKCLLTWVLMPFITVGPSYLDSSVTRQEQFPLLVEKGTVACINPHPSGAQERGYSLWQWPPDS